MSVRRFAYAREPLCLLSGLLYLCNTCWWKRCVDDPASFVHCYLGDVLCLPVLLPATLWLQRVLGLRAHDGAPTAREWFGHWLVWSLCFEAIGPAMPLLAPGAVCDPWDAVAYGAGGAAAAAVWRRGRGGVAVRGSAGAFGRLCVAAVVAALVLSAYRVGAALR